MKNGFKLFLFAAVILVIFFPSYMRMQDLRAKNLQGHREIEALNRKNSELIEEKRRLEEDPVYLEKVAREKMGLIREGEMIYRLKNSDK